MRIGLERPDVLADRLADARFGLLANHASVDVDLRFAWDVLAEAFPGQMAAIFTPQHGMWGTEQANMVESPHGFHPELQVPVYSLYSETRRPTAEMLADLDCLVVDLQDVGTRVYTFAWTVKGCLEACSEYNVRVVVLDRPNPLGRQVEGPLLQQEFRSFVGGSCIPLRHGLTLGELAAWINDKESIGADLSIVEVTDWDPDTLQPAWQRTWLPPSPNLPRFESVLTYPGQVLLEGTNISEGRGTTRPFETCGAPFIDPTSLSDRLNAANLPGVRFLPGQFVPTFDKWAQQNCGGVTLHISDSLAFRPVRTSVTILATIKLLYPNEFQWLEPPYEYETDKMPIDILFGSSALREQLEGSVLDVLSSSSNLLNVSSRWNP